MNAALEGSHAGSDSKMHRGASYGNANQIREEASCFNSDKMENPCQCHCVAAALLFGLRLFADRSTSAKQLCCDGMRVYKAQYSEPKPRVPCFYVSYIA